MASYYRRKKPDQVFLNAKPINSGNAQAYLHGVRKYSIGLAERLDSGYQQPANEKRSSISTVGSINHDFTPVSHRYRSNERLYIHHYNLDIFVRVFSIAISHPSIGFFASSVSFPLCVVVPLVPSLLSTLQPLSTRSYSSFCWR